jgi:hypothetical protein
MSVTIDSRIYKDSFYGILNANGAFWTPLAFDSPAKAEKHLRDFFNPADCQWQGMRSKFRIVPVRIQLTAITEADEAKAA